MLSSLWTTLVCGFWVRRTIRCAVQDWALESNMRTAARRLSGPHPRILRGTIRFFGSETQTPEPAGGVVPLVFRNKFAGNHWVDNWTINGKSFPKTDPIRVRANYRYRLRLDNQSDEAHPVHLHRHTFELTRFAGKATAGVRKDVIVVPARKQVEVDFTADNPGPTLL